MLPYLAGIKENLSSFHMPEILLSTLNAKYVHASMGLRCIFANMGELKETTKIVEFTIDQAVEEIVETVLKQNVKIIGFGIYIWNIEPTFKVIQILRQLQPNLKIVLGGPEVSHEKGDQPICDLADVTIGGEADTAFSNACQKLLLNEPIEKFVPSQLPDLKTIKMPYTEYNSEDLKNRIIYVEVSRGCPFKCEFCLSSIDEQVRSFPLDEFLNQMKSLLDQGCRIFKFVDRTFNLKASMAEKIMDFFKANWQEGVFLHFEMVPDRLPEGIRDRIATFPHGAIQFEIGIQSFTPEVGTLISRRMNFEKTKENFEFIREKTHVHTHADLIIGLPGETLETLAISFNMLWELGPDEIQVGILKRLKGTPIIRHSEKFELIFRDDPPFDILQNIHLPFPTMQKLKRFARYYEIFANGGRFPKSLERLVQLNKGLAFEMFWEWTEELFEKLNRVHAISFTKQIDEVYQKLLSFGESEAEAVEVLTNDFCDPISNPKASQRGLPNYMHVAVAKKMKQLKTS